MYMYIYIVDITLLVSGVGRSDQLLKVAVHLESTSRVSVIVSWSCCSTSDNYRISTRIYNVHTDTHIHSKR